MDRQERMSARASARNAVRQEREASDKREAGWYVLQVLTGTEVRMAHEVEQHCFDVVEECFCPVYATQKKIRGTWHDHTAMLFPGYVIAVTREPAALKTRLCDIGDFARLLFLGDSFTRLAPSEQAWIGAFTTRENRVIPMSMGVAEGDFVRVLKGPLLGHEAWIYRVDRKRSIAYIELEMFGRHIQTKIGLGVVRKKPCLGELGIKT